MTPQELSAEIRRIASGIENSKKPSRELVAADIKRLLNHLATSGAAEPVVAGGGKDHAEKTMHCRLKGNTWYVKIGENNTEREYHAPTLEGAIDKAAEHHPWAKSRLKREESSMPEAPKNPSHPAMDNVPNPKY